LGTVLTKYALGGFTSLTLLPLQLVFSVIFLAAVLAIRQDRPRLTVENRRVAMLGILNPGVAYALGLLGLSRIDASISVVLWATEPLIIMVLAVLILRERVTASNALALGVAMTGVLLIVGKPSGTATLIGVLLTLAAVAACALYSVILRGMHLTDGTTSIVFLQQVAALAFAAVVLAAVLLFRGASLTDPTALQSAAAVSGGVLYYGAAFLLFVSGLRATTAARAGLYLTLIPVFGLLFSSALLGERLGSRQLAGAALVVGAMAAFSLQELFSDRRTAAADAHALP
jgi:drug/metabolite transporter (DMT)-like permease